MLKTEKAAAKQMTALAANMRGRSLDQVHAVALLALAKVKGNPAKLVTLCRDPDWIEELCVELDEKNRNNRASKEREEHARKVEAEKAEKAAEGFRREAFRHALGKRLGSFFTAGEVVTIDHPEGPEQYRLTNVAGELHAKRVRDEGNRFAIALALSAIVMPRVPAAAVAEGPEWITLARIRELVKKDAGHAAAS